MARKSAGFAVPSLAVFALVATTIGPLGRQATDSVRVPDQIGREEPAALILAQGRCYNGKCF